MLQPKSTRPSDTQTAAGHGARNAYVGASATAFSTYLKCGHGSACFVARWPVVVMGAEVMSMVFLVTFQLHWNKMKHAFTAFGNVFKRGVCSDRSQPRCPSPMMKGGGKSHAIVQLRGIQYRYSLVSRQWSALVGRSGGGRNTMIHEYS